MFTLSRLLVPTDFSDVSLEALDEALKLASVFNAQVYLLHVVESGGGLEYAASLEEYRETQVPGIENEFKRVLARYPDRNIVTDFRFGFIGREIVTFADTYNIDMIVMATHGRNGLKRLLMGSTTELVVRTAECPVLTVRPPAVPATV